MRCLMAISLLLALHVGPARAVLVVRADERAPLRVLLVNSGPHKILAAYACAPSAAHWGDNLLTVRALQPEQQTLLELKGGCGTYNLRFVADDGIEYLEDEVAFCNDRQGVQAATDTSAAARAYLILGRNDLEAVDVPRATGREDGERRPR